MPVVMNQREQESKKTEAQKPAQRIQAVPRGGLLSDARTLPGIFVGAILLVVGLLAWSLGWIGGTAPTPVPPSSQTAGKTTLPLGSSDEANPIGNKRNKGMGE